MLKKGVLSIKRYWIIRKKVWPISNADFRMGNGEFKAQEIYLTMRRASACGIRAGCTVFIAYIAVCCGYKDWYEEDLL